MNTYEKMIKIMRDSGKFYNAPVPQIGIVSEEGKIKIDTMILEKGEYLINSNLRLSDEKKYFLHTQKPTQSGEYLSSSDHNYRIEEYRKDILEVGDLVLMLKLQDIPRTGDREIYVAIAKVVKYI